MTHTARCCCGACVVEVEGEPVFNALCHCDDCRRRTGSAFGWSIYVRDDQIVRRDGDYGVYSPAPTPNTRRFFCRACGTTLLWSSPDFMAGCTGIAGGAFADPPAPALSARGAQRQPWVRLPEGWPEAP